MARHLNLALASELDGYNISVKPLPERGKGRVYESPGGQLWMVDPEGLREFKDGAWMLHPVPEIAAEPHISTVLDSVPLCPIKQGLVVFLLPDRLLEFNSAGAGPPRVRALHSVAQSRLGRFTGMTPARDGGLWVSGDRGVAKVPGPLRSLKGETPWIEYLVPESLGISGLQGPHDTPRPETLDQPQPILVAMAESVTNHQKVMALFDGQDWTVDRLPPGRPRQVWCGPDQTRWAMTIDSLFEWDAGPRTEPAESDEIFARQYFDLAVEPGGDFWLATSDGLFRYSPPLWRTPRVVRQVNALVPCVTGDADGRLWFISGTRIYGLQDGRLDSYVIPVRGSRVLQGSSVFCLKNRTLVLTTEDPESSAGSQVWTLDPLQGRVQPLASPNPATGLRPLGLLADGSLCFQTLTSPGSAATWSLTSPMA